MYSSPLVKCLLLHRRRSESLHIASTQVNNTLQEKNDYGVLLLFLSYSAVDAMLIVTVAKAYNLRPMDITGASGQCRMPKLVSADVTRADPYVKIEQIHENRRVRKRKTTIKRANLNPVYHETLEFQLEEQDIDRTNLLVKVMDWDRCVEEA